MGAKGSYKNGFGHGKILRWDRHNPDPYAKPEVVYHPEFAVIKMITRKDRLFAQVGIRTIHVLDLNNFQKLEEYQCGLQKTCSSSFEVYNDLLFINRVDPYHHIIDNTKIYVLDLNDKKAVPKKIYDDIGPTISIQMCGSSLLLVRKYLKNISVLDYSLSPEELKKIALPLNAFEAVTKEPYSENLGCAPQHPQKMESSPVNDTPLLLKDLGILSKEQYSENLGCAPHHLKEIGILSDADLSVLGIGFHPLPHLQPLQGVVENPNDNRDLQKAAFQKKDSVVACLGLLKSKAEERLSCPILNYIKGHNPWDSFLEKIKAAHTDLQSKSTTAKLLINTFQEGSYSQLIAQMNALIDECNALENTHQVSLLKEYVSQWGILRAWKNLSQKGIFCLSDLSNSHQNFPQDFLFKMGE